MYQFPLENMPYMELISEATCCVYLCTYLNYRISPNSQLESFMVALDFFHPQKNLEVFRVTADD